MESLIEKSSLMQVPSDLFLSQAFAQGHQQIANGQDSFAASESAMMPMIQRYKASAANALKAKSLTSREAEILELLGTGLSVKGAARELNISPGTVKWHVKNIYYKLGASSREDALSKARLRKVI